MYVLGLFKILPGFMKLVVEEEQKIFEESVDGAENGATGESCGAD